MQQWTLPCGDLVKGVDAHGLVQEEALARLDPASLHLVEDALVPPVSVEIQLVKMPEKILADPVGKCNVKTIKSKLLTGLNYHCQALNVLAAIEALYRSMSVCLLASQSVRD